MDSATQATLHPESVQKQVVLSTQPDQKHSNSFVSGLPCDTAAHQQGAFKGLFKVYAEVAQMQRLMLNKNQHRPPEKLIPSIQIRTEPSGFGPFPADAKHLLWLKCTNHRLSVSLVPTGTEQT